MKDDLLYVGHIHDSIERILLYTAPGYGYDEGHRERFALRRRTIEWKTEEGATLADTSRSFYLFQIFNVWTH